MKRKIQVSTKLPLIVLTGATTSGKTAVAQELYSTKKYEIISADSRQLFKGLDIGTGKNKSFPQAMIDVCDPPVNNHATRYNVSMYREAALANIHDVHSRGKIPVLVGGTGFYIESIIFEQSTSTVSPNQKLRKALEALSNQDLLHELQQKDPRTAKIIDSLNRVRLVRAVEIVRQTGKPIEPLRRQLRSEFAIRIFVLDVARDQLYQNIDASVDERLKQGMIEEVEGLIKSGVSVEWLMSLGLEYRFITEYLLKQNVISTLLPQARREIPRDLSDPAPNGAGGRDDIEYNEMVQKLKNAIHAYARRQITFFKRWLDARWLSRELVKEAIMKQNL